MERIKNVIFDFDGTLADTTAEIVSVTKATILELGLPAKSHAECCAMIGVKMEDIGPEFWPGIAGLGQLFADTYRRIAAERGQGYGASLFPGVRETLSLLRDRGIGLAVASSRQNRSLTGYLEHLSILDFFCRVVGGDDVARAKPAPDAVESICRSVGWEAGECVMVGDAVVDLQMGKAAGALTCAAAYGNQAREVLERERPTFVIESISELESLIFSPRLPPRHS